MEQNEISQRIEELEREISALPPGNVSTKTVKGKEYYYHRYTINGKRNEDYIDFEKVEELRNQIEKRKELEAELKVLKRSLASSKPAKKKKDSHEFLTYVRIDDQLKSYASHVKSYKKRECYSKLQNYVFGEHQDKVFILYGLRRTGKTTLIRQALLDMSAEQLAKAAFIQVKSKDTLSNINTDLK